MTESGGSTSAAPQLASPNADPGKLSSAERRILNALADGKPYQGKALASRAGYKYTTVRPVLPGMVRRGLLIHGPDGYRLAEPRPPASV
jgi:DNA-binding MarR family transcriptional regulator